MSFIGFLVFFQLNFLILSLLFGFFRALNLDFFEWALIFCVQIFYRYLFFNHLLFLHDLHLNPKCFKLFLTGYNFHRYRSRTQLLSFDPRYFGCMWILNLRYDRKGFYLSLFLIVLLGFCGNRCFFAWLNFDLFLFGL